MGPYLTVEEQAAARGLLRQLRESASTPLDARWTEAVSRVPRGVYVPGRIYLDGEPLDRDTDPDGWLKAAYAMQPVVTQRDDRMIPTSSASDPGVVVTMLHDLDVRPGDHVLEVGTGTGWNAALLAQVAESVVTVEVDPALGERAARLLRDHAANVRVVVGDGALGAWAGAPYSRIIATCSVRSIPAAWLAQACPGAVIVTPWSTSWAEWGTARLVVDERGCASGRFAAYGSFMQLRGERVDLRIFRDVVRDEHVPDESVTALDPLTVTGEDWNAAFAVGLSVPDVWHTQHVAPDVDGVAVRTWLATADAASWAAVDWDGDDDAATWTVWQHGPRRLWDEVAAAHAWWEAAERPDPSRFGVTVTPARQWTWLDTPAHPVG